MGKNELKHEWNGMQLKLCQAGKTVCCALPLNATNTKTVCSISQNQIGNVDKLIFFYGIVGFLLFINLVLFASTARQLTCGLWKREEVKSTTER